MLLSFLCIVFIIYMVCSELTLVRYSVAVYYVVGATSFTMLCTGNQASISYIYKLHDLVVGHFLFLVLALLSLLQLGYFQTWLLYHDALSSGVEIEDVLKHTRKSKNRVNATNTEEVSDSSTNPNPNPNPNPNLNPKPNRTLNLTRT